MHRFSSRGYYNSFIASLPARKQRINYGSDGNILFSEAIASVIFHIQYDLDSAIMLELITAVEAVAEKRWFDYGFISLAHEW